MEVKTNFEIELRGYNKEEVNAYIKDLGGEYKKELKELEDRNKDLQKKVDDLTKRLEVREAQKEQLEHEIETKYRTYIDNYDKIAGLVYESQIKADQILAEAHEKENAVLTEADQEAARRVGAVQGDINDALEDGRIRYDSIRAEMNSLMGVLDNAQRAFLEGYRKVHGILAEMPGSLEERLDKASETGDLDEDDFDSDEFEMDDLGNGEA